MQIEERIAAYRDDLVRIRRDIHAHPETAFEEERTADIVARHLEEWGIEIDRGLATTGVVGTLTAGSGNRRIGLRADMDALHLHERNTFAHRSTHDGKMHACGHDGHTTMLLGAARYLAENPDFDGTVHFIFQPAEEGLGGARVMIEEGLFEKFPCDAVYGMHNMPGIEAGQIGLRDGPILAASDSWRVVMRGTGGHGSMPYQGTDPTVAAGQFIVALQSIVTRNINALESAVISIGHLAGGDEASPNVIPSEVRIRGTARSFRPEVRDILERRIGEVAHHAAATLGVAAEYEYERRYPATINHTQETETATRAAIAAVGEDSVIPNVAPMPGGEDFSYMLEKVPGSYVLIGNGTATAESFVHAPLYDFNDDIIVAGASFWAHLVAAELGGGRG
jgi:hippurate hydrolase